MRKHAVLGAVALAVAACQDATSPRSIPSSLPGPSASAAASENDYIVTFRADESDPAGLARALVAAHGGQVRFIYDVALKGFAVTNLPDAAVEALARNPRVASIERDGVMTAVGVQTPTPSWGLDRIDAAAGLDQSYTYPNDGSGVTAYIIDTGINAGSSDFTGRIGVGQDYVDGGTPDDCNGHGTHVAGTVGGTTYGVAKNVTIVAVRVLNCRGSGTTSGVIAGVNWVAANASKPAVANMSLGGSFSSSLNSAVAGAVSAGVTFAVAAGNSNASACNYSPSSEPSAITVGATTSTDAKASYSNYGTCVDINAPGSSITSDWIGSATATNTISGTSMASPHVAGAAALYLSANPGAAPSAVATALTGNATNGVVTGLPSGTPNKLLYVSFIGGSTGGGGGGPIDPPPAVDASFDVSCTMFACTFTPTTRGLSSYQWDFGDGATSNLEAPIHSYREKGGSYIVTLSVTGGQSSRTVSCNPKRGCS